ncbi:DinB family protein [Nocardioides sp. CFH 31398]|uniref:DinB family protein n=1 Tax=Nocardioides sp. CFH 31398 TaxID=2919579 RepID=UPI001F070EF6|nr:DinB family protein [Nocardioides sp. CFH 31398]MCH1868171.1 DinB family protein [Nocardioides sp. CFH 31398]
MTETPPEPPIAGSEVEVLRGFLDFYRVVLRRKTDGLDAAALDHPLPPSTMTLGGMLKHLAFVEQHWIGYMAAGHDQVEPWASAPWADDEDWDWHSAADDDPDAVRVLHARTVERCDALLDDLVTGPEGLDRLVARTGGHGGRVSLRWVLVHLVEEYARHAGHADLLREAVDGVTGD